MLATIQLNDEVVFTYGDGEEVRSGTVVGMNLRAQTITLRDEARQENYRQFRMVKVKNLQQRVKH